ncbi:hypothetical protein L0F63_003449 [Massospora cicadina]|nr:hypothetical protein L0F63_003449 [Massospora cicadina]
MNSIETSCVSQSDDPKTVTEFTLEALVARVRDAAQRLERAQLENMMEMVREVVFAQYHMLVCCQMDNLDSQLLNDELAYECFIQVIQGIVRLITQARIACESAVDASMRVKDCVYRLDASVTCFVPEAQTIYEERLSEHINYLSLGRESLLGHLDELSTKIMDSAAALLHNMHYRPTDPCIILVEKYAMNTGQLISLVGDFRVCRYSNTVYDSECLQYFTNFFSAKHAVATALEDLLRLVEDTSKENLTSIVMVVLRSSEEMITVAKALLENPSYAQFVVNDFCSLRSTEFKNSELERLKSLTEALARINSRQQSNSSTPKLSGVDGSTSLKTDEVQAEPREPPLPSCQPDTRFLNGNANSIRSPRQKIIDLLALIIFPKRSFRRRSSFNLGLNKGTRAAPSSLTYVLPTGKVCRPRRKSSPSFGFLSSGLSISFPLGPTDEPCSRVLTRFDSVSQSVPSEPFLGRDCRVDELTFDSHGVTGGTLDALVEMLTLHDKSIDPDYINTFLLTFRSFCAPAMLLDKLINRFSLTPPADLTFSQQQIWHKHKLLPIRLNVYNILKVWLETYFFASEDKEILEKVGRFAQGPLKEAFTQVVAAQLSVLVHDKIASMFVKPAAASHPYRPKQTNRLVRPSHSSVLASPPPSPQISKATAKLIFSNTRFSLLNIHPLEVARQLTLLVSKVFCSITLSELINREFSKPAQESNATFVNKKAQTSTRITSLINRLILTEPQIKHRASWIKFFIEVAEYLLSLRNYGTLASIMCALQTSAVNRLHQTWKLVPAKHMDVLERLRGITDHTRNYHTLRNHLRVATTPCLPFLGIYLTDLTFADEGNPTYRPSSRGSAPIINFSKCQRMARIIQEIQRFQVPYNLIEVVELQTQLHLLLLDQTQSSDLNERNMYRLSLQLEPRRSL